MTDFAVQPPRPFVPVPSIVMDEQEVWRDTSDDTSAKPAPNYGRLTLITLNLILVVLAAIFAVVGWEAAQDKRTSYEQEQHAEYCALWDYGEPDLPDDCPKPVRPVEDILNDN